MNIRFLESRMGLRNSTTRIAFRYGNACLTRCPQAILHVTIEADGKRQSGFSGDCLPPSWFDKSPQKDYRQQIEDMLAVIAMGEEAFAKELNHPSDFFSAWLAVYEQVHSRATEQQLTPLLASFGVSMVERAIMDAMCRAAGLSFFEATRKNVFKIDPSEMHGDVLQDVRLADAVAEQPRQSIYVRHTVGLGDPLVASEIAADERLDDGFPQALDEYVQRTGLRYFKIKVSNDLDRDVDRLIRIATLVENVRGDDYQLTLDGNEQYKSAGEFQNLIDQIRGTDQLQTLWNSTLCIEQPLERSIALDTNHTSGIRELAEQKAVIIDESDGTMQSYVEAIEAGYRGVSSKNCKGPIRSLVNACLTWIHNDRGQRRDYLMTGEDLCSVGVVPVQADMCLVSTLGLSHIERNGHHYHPGLTYLPESQRRAALEAHGDFYAEQNGIIAPRLADGQFQIGSLHCVGFGFAVEPDFELMQSPDEWEYESLGLGE